MWLDNIQKRIVTTKSGKSHVSVILSVIRLTLQRKPCLKEAMRRDA